MYTVHVKFFDVSRDKSTVFGLTLVLISIVVAYAVIHNRLLLIPLCLVATCIAWPSIFKPFAYIFYNITEAIGKVLSILVLSIVFFLIITPIGLLKKFLGHDSMRINEWKKDADSVFTCCDHLYSPMDFRKLF